LKEFIKKLDHFLQKSKTKPSRLKHFILAAYVIEDLELISSIIPNLYHKVSMKVFKIDEEAEISASPDNLLEKVDTGGDRFLQIENPRVMESYSVGHLIPLASGHNGAMSAQELDIYEYHLRKSRLAS
jgi:hypothetical protein